MEKFGIFQLLDALSALTPSKKEEDMPSNTVLPKEQTAFSPPFYKNEEGTKTQNIPSMQTKEDALSSFLARHDALSKKIDEKK